MNEGTKKDLGLSESVGSERPQIVGGSFMVDELPHQYPSDAGQ
jgi:hypothetical protein